MSFTNPNFREPTNPEVSEYLHYFEANGAERVSDNFTVASPEEAEFIFDDHRYLMAPRDAHFKRYTEILKGSEAPFIGEAAEFSDEKIVVGEISRDARTLPQVMRSKQPNRGETLAAVFRDMGHTLGSIIDSSTFAPVAGSLALSRILVLRESSRVLLPPSVDFEVANDDSREKVVAHITKELLPVYEKFGGLVLLDAFKQGINYDDSRS